MENQFAQIGRTIHILVLFMSITACTKNTESIEPFTVLNPTETGLHFNNVLKETTYNNGFFYHYYYNGAGVAVADFNNDGFQDIYFISNLESNVMFLNQGNLKFKDATKLSKLEGKSGFPTGVTVVDINNDGRMDIYICKSGSTENKLQLQNELYVNQGNGRDGVPVFAEKAGEYGLDVSYRSTQASFFDYDRDGDLDMFLINHGKNVYNDQALERLMNQKSDGGGEILLRNDKGTFVDATEEAGIMSNDLGYALGISIGDINNDHWPDIYIAHDYSEKDHLYLNHHDGTFKETSLQSFGHVSNFSMGTDIADINNDGLLDIMSLDMMASDNYTQKTSMSGMNPQRFYKHVDLGLHHQYMYNALQINNGIDPKSGLPMFSDIAQLAGVSSTDWSWSPLFFDMDNDGLKDLFVSNGIKRDFRNNDFGIYKRKKQEQAYRTGKLDKDAYMADMFEKMPGRKKENHFYNNNGDLTFDEIEFDQPKTSSNGSAYADFDNDGDLDIVVNNSEDNALIYRNNSKKTNYLKVNLLGSENNKNALGARVEITTKGKRQLKERYFSRGFQSAMADDIHFGLGKNAKVDSLWILWPDGQRQLETNILANQQITIPYNPNSRKVIERTGPNHIFKDITGSTGITFEHNENVYNDFQIESLMPHKMSTQGPALALGDINNDGLDDFYIGGARNQEAQLFVQDKNGRFKTLANPDFMSDKYHEDTGAHFFDADGDGDLDLYVVSGGNEEKPDSYYYQDRFYVNEGNGDFKRSVTAIPDITISGRAIDSGDFDNDGDLDLFIGSRMKPMNYGQYSDSHVLENRSVKGKIQFADVTDEIFPFMREHTMVTDAEWADVDNDGQLDLLVSNEWGAIEIFKNTNGKFIDATKTYGLDKHIGWWNCLKVTDIDKDGDLDILAGNLGLNYKYKATSEKPFYMYVNDFDGNTTNDIVLGYHQDQEIYPLRGRECSSNQMPFIKEKFQSYDAFGKAKLDDIYGIKLNSAIRYEATNFASGIFVNQGGQEFIFVPFENSAQISSVNEILISDFDGDKHNDLILLGNLYESEVETPRNDASYGAFLKGDGKGEFSYVPSIQSGLYVKGNVKNAAILNSNKKERLNSLILIAKNNDSLKVLLNK